MFLCDVPQALQFLDSDLPSDSIQFGYQGDGGASADLYRALAMGTEHLPPHTQGRLAEPSVRADENTADATSLLRGDEPALRDDEHTDDIISLLEENARLRRLLVQLSSIILRNAAEPR